MMNIVQDHLLRSAILSSSLETLLEMGDFPLASQLQVLVTERVAALRELSETPTVELVTWVSPANKTLVMGTREEYALDIA